MMSFRRGSFCSAHVQALETEDPCSCRGPEQFHEAAAAEDKLHDCKSPSSNAEAMGATVGTLGHGPFSGCQGLGFLLVLSLACL